MKQKRPTGKKPQQEQASQKENAIEATSAVLKIHKRYVAGIKWAWRQLQGKNRVLLPETHLLRCLPIPTPPMLEEALGYHGRLRFVAFYYSPGIAEPVHSDGGDALPIDRAAWDVFTSHPAVCPVLEDFHTLYGRLSGCHPLLSPSEFSALGVASRRSYCGRFHLLVLDRETRQMFLGNWDATILFLNLAEPDEEMHVEMDDGRLVIASNERVPAATAKSVVSALKAWLDDQLIDDNIQRRLADWHAHHGRIQESMRILDRLRGRTDDPQLLRTLGSTLMKTHEFERACSAFEGLVRADNNDYEARLDLARCYLELHRYDDAIVRPTPSSV